jgi:hypothetical protein
MLKLLSGTFVGAAMVLMLIPLAHAITITGATLSSGTVTVSGNKAAKSAAISWEATPVTTSTRVGTFTFTTASVPADCVGTLSDGASTIVVAINDCTPAPPPVTFPATGQTTCWNSSGAVIACPGTGQDGDIKAGAALSYTDNADGTITDHNTGLMWEKKGDDGTIHDKDNSYTWANAFTVHVAGLNAGAGFAGYTDWRLPNVKELQSIVNYEHVNPAVSPAFNNSCAASCTVLTCSCTVAYNYWSSSSYAYNPPTAWYVNFFVGNVNDDFKNFSAYVRAVRGGL